MLAMVWQKKKKTRKSVLSQTAGPQETSLSMPTRFIWGSASAGGNLPLATYLGVQKRASATGGTRRSKRWNAYCCGSKYCNSERNDETATVLTTANIPRIAAEDLRNFTNSGDFNKDNADDDDPATQNENCSSGKDEGIPIFLYWYCVS